MEIDGRVFLKKLLLTTALTPAFLTGCMPVSYPRDGAQEDVAVQVTHEVSEEVSAPPVRPKKVAISKKMPTKKTLDFTDENGFVCLRQLFYYSGELQQETSFYPNGNIALETNFSKAGVKVKECAYEPDGSKSKEVLFDKAALKLKEVFYRHNREVSCIYYRNGVKVSEDIVDEAQSTVMEKRYIGGVLVSESFSQPNRKMQLFYGKDGEQCEKYFTGEGDQEQLLSASFYVDGQKMADVSYDETGFPQDMNFYHEGNFLRSVDFSTATVLVYTMAGQPYEVQTGWQHILMPGREFLSTPGIVKKTEQPSLQQPFLQQWIRAVRLFNNRM